MVYEANHAQMALIQVREILLFTQPYPNSYHVSIRNPCLVSGRLVTMKHCQSWAMGLYGSFYHLPTGACL
jgi:hypothetical protein